MKKRYPFFLIGGLMLFLALSQSAAQSNETMDQFLEQEKASCGHSAYMILTAVGLLDEEASVEEALAVLAETEVKGPSGPANETITLGEYSYLLMQALEIEGGLMYRLFPGPRYAARELKYLDLIPGESSPRRSLSGAEAVQILGRALEWKEARS